MMSTDGVALCAKVVERVDDGRAADRRRSVTKQRRRHPDCGRITGRRRPAAGHHDGVGHIRPSWYLRSLQRRRSWPRDIPNVPCDRVQAVEKLRVTRVEKP
jgi:hypothetical protein